MDSTMTMPREQQALWAQGIHLADAVKDDEEEEYLKANPAIVPVFDIDVMAILGDYEDTLFDKEKKFISFNNTI